MYYDYTNLFNQIITKQGDIINILKDLLLYLQVFGFIFTCYFLYILISRMIKGRS